MKLGSYTEALLRWCGEGLHDPQVSDRLLIEHGVDVTREAIAYWRARMGVPAQPPPRKLTDAQIQRLRRQHADGKSYTWLEGYWGISRPTVWKYLREERT